MQHLSKWMQFLGFLFPHAVQKHKLGEMENNAACDCAYFLGNSSAKNYQN